MNNQQAQVCVLTGRGMSAIGSVALAGAGARGVLDSIFQKGKTEASSGSEGMGNSKDNRVTAVPRYCRGDIQYGMIVDGERVVDEVLVGCEADDSFVIHCHGNPLLIEQVVKLCQSKGAELVDASAFAFQRHAAESGNIIEAEAKLAMQTSATLLGAKILNAQIDGGLSKWAQDTLANIDTLDTADVQQQAGAILEKSRIAKRIIDGVRIVIAGPPNSG
ncbi:MAG: P-loop NTPase family protein, partial [Planctomycetota bacterium]